ncbi:Serine carboxypeptidase-like 20-like protein, partial [Drosera capensis]
MDKKLILLNLLLLLIISFCFSCIQAAPQSALIKQLPGFTSKFPSKHYSGYVKLDGTAGKPPKYLFYYFVESERNPSKDPVLLWLNGGPGCSSFDGFVYEHGPFNFRAGKTKGSRPTLHLNIHSWSKVSNIIYLDSPVGVGFSYSPNTTDYSTGDLQTASDTHAFLLKWFREYPEFSKNPFYLSGESYAGIYVPTLAAKVVEGIKAKVQPIINFKGYLIGNGVVADDKYEDNAILPFAHGMGLISDDLFKASHQLTRTKVKSCGEHYNKNDDPGCMKYQDEVDEVPVYFTSLFSALSYQFRLVSITDNSMVEYQALDELNIHDILEPCYHKPETERKSSNSSLPESFKQLGKTDRPLPVRKRMFGRAWPYRLVVKDGLVPSWPQLSVESRGVHVPCFERVIGAWAICVRVAYTHDAGSMIKYHKHLTAQGYRALIYSGDHDMCVPYTGTQAWTSTLGNKAIDGWRPWMVDHQVAGYLQEYEHNLIFLTIKGAGHTVPEYKPQEALAFISR